MGDTHVISALRTKRAEVSGYIHDLEKKVRHLRASLAHIDATIRLFSPETDPNAIPPRRTYRRSRYFMAGEVTKRCQDVLRKASAPMTTAAIAQALMDAKGLDSGDAALARHVSDGVLLVMRKMAKRGAVVKTGESRSTHWTLAKVGAE